MKILDATCGFRGLWYQKNHPLVTYMDKRKGKFVHYLSPRDKRYYDVNPDVVADWTKRIPFDNDYFDLVFFDPPHIIKKPSKPSRLEIEYTVLHKDTWRQDLLNAFKELFRVLKPEGVLILKWCESNKKIMDIIKLSPYKPIFSNKSLTNNPNGKDTYMVVFLKYDVNMKLDKIQT